MDRSTQFWVLMIMLVLIFTSMVVGFFWIMDCIKEEIKIISYKITSTENQLTRVENDLKISKTDIKLLISMNRNSPPK